MKLSEFIGICKEMLEKQGDLDILVCKGFDDSLGEVYEEPDLFLDMVQGSIVIW